jgi:superfamily II DNA or RNA helicase
MPKLRDYQREAVEAAQAAYRNGLRRIGISLPTGCGKTHIMGQVVQDVHRKDRTSVTLLHRDTLVEQTVRRYLEFVPPEAIGVVKARRNEIDKPVIIASVQSLRSADRLAQLPLPSLTLVDEAHVSASPMYRRVFDCFDAVPGGRGFLLGFTATWMRSDKRGLGDIWEKVVFKRSIKWAVDRGYLVRPEPLQLGGNLDLSQVRTGADGDYNEKDLGEAVMLEDLRDTVVKGYHAVTPGRSAVLFAPTQESARYFGAALKEAGVSVAEIFASTGVNARRWAFHGYDTGAIKVLVTCTALAEGWDAPRCDTALLVRPTRHLGLFLQQAGRVLRPWPGKDRAYLLDFVGVLDDKVMASAIDLSTTPEKEQGRELSDEVEEEYDDTPERVSMAKKIEGIHHVDLFAGTNARWLCTDYGIPFVSTRDKIYFVAPVNGAWNVGVTGNAYSMQGGRWIAEGLASHDALEVGSEAALEEDPSISDKRAAWRQGNKKPTDTQIAYAQKLGISTEGLSKAQVSDAIDIRRANKIFAVYQNNEVVA